MLIGFSPAKANLFFKVIAKRPDGYHEVASLYTALSLGDRIYIELNEIDLFSSNEKTLLADSSNLVIRARDAFRKATHILDPISIRLEKNIPIGRGLGGGSSNAATVLWMMNELFRRPLCLDELISIASTIGSDVPFFFSKGLAYCEGRGEILKETDVEVESSLWIASPHHYSLATPVVYANCKPGEDESGVNDLEPAVFRLIPELKQFKQNLISMGFSKVSMTGSGSAFLCFGGPLKPTLADTTFYAVSTIQRDLNNWYREGR
jgi:4-diphosphocytidyl-2-C-methyl-D-erythritol kinase